MIPFILGFICGFAGTGLFYAMICLAKSRGKLSRAEEKWNDKD